MTDVAGERVGSGLDALFRALFEQSPLSVQVLSPVGETVAVNAAWERLWGITLVDLPGYNILEDPQLAANGVLPLLRLAFAGEPTAIPPVAYVPDRGAHAGQARWVRAFASPIRDDAGTVAHVLLVHEDVTDLVAAQEALRAREEQLRLAVEAADLGTWELDLATGVMACSARCKANFGRPRDAPFPYEALLAAIYPDDRAGMEAAVRRAVVEGERYEVEYRAVWPDGSVHWIAAAGRTIAHEAGHPVQMAGVTHDITERKRAEEGLARLAAIVESTDDAILSRTLDGAITTWNRGAERLYGYPADEVLGRHVSALVPPDRQHELEHITERMTRGERMEHFETVRLRKDGTQVDVSISLSPVKDAAGRVVAVATIARDISERRRVETERARLLEQERAARAEAEAAVAIVRRVQAVTDAALAHLSLPDLLDALLDRMRELLTADTAAVLLLDADDASLVVRAAKGLEEEVEQGVRVPVGQGFAGRIAAERRSITVEHLDRADVFSPTLREKGVRSLLGAPLLVEGRVLGVVHVGTLSPRRFSDSDVRLLQLVADRMALAIDQARLYEAERRARAEAEEAVAARDRFLSVAAHELRTPVTVVKGLAQLLARPPRTNVADADRRARLLSQLAEASDRLAALTEDLLDVSRLRLGQLPLRPRPLDLAVVVRTVVERHRDALDGHHALEVAVGEETRPVPADPDRMEQVLDNLLDNAIKYSPDGGRVEVAVQPDGNGVLIRVRDEGIGLPPGAVEAIFEPFGRAANATRANLPGLGLGLHICRSIVQQHGGRIWAESAGEGQGTTLSVWLPSEARTEAPTEDGSGIAEGERGGGPHLG